MRPSSEMRRRLVEHLRRHGYLHDLRVAAAFREVPREAFLPEQLSRVGLAGVYRDEAIVTRRDPTSQLPTSSSSQPAIMALMLEMLDVRPGHRVVEIGAGTGYNAALLERLTRPGGKVVTVDIDADVARQAVAALRAVGARAAEVLVADGTRPLPLTGTVDRLEVTASTAAIPRAWYEQLGPSGRLVVPLRFSDEPERTHVVTAFAKVPGGFDSVALTPGGFMPLRRRDGSPFESDVPPAGPPAPSVSAPPSPPSPSTPSSSSPSTPSASPHTALTRGPFPGISRDDMSHLRLTVRYDAPPPAARWTFRRDDHWITAEVDRRPGDNGEDTGELASPTS